MAQARAKPIENAVSNLKEATESYREDYRLIPRRVSCLAYQGRNGYEYMRVWLSG